MGSMDENLRRQVRLCEWIQEHLSIKYELDSQRERLALACFDIAIEHHASIVLLVQSQLYGSAFALLRVEFEALVRGMWLRHAASPHDIELFLKDKVNLSFKELIGSIEETSSFKHEMMSVIKEAHWSIFNSFTHTGVEALKRRIGAKTTGFDNYNEDDVCKGLRMAGLMAGFAAVELAEICQDQSLLSALTDIMRKYAKDIL